jgi:hypothetical protein
MAAWAPLLALSGFLYHGAEQSVIIAPGTRATEFRSFWSTGTGWGTFRQAVQNGSPRLHLRVAQGSLPCRSIETGRAVPAGTATAVRIGGKAVDHKLTRERGRSIFVFAHPVEVTASAALEIDG